MIEVRTQAELDKALKKTDGGKKELVACIGDGHFIVTGNARVVAWGSSSVEARESSSVEARESSSVEARESSSVEAWGSSSVEAWGSSSVRVFGCKSVKASKHAVVMQHNPAANITGGRILEMHHPQNGQEWCEFYGVEIRKGGNLSRKLAGQDVAILYKAVGEKFHTRNGVHYTPGTAPEAPDWDGGEAECGGGLHFSPHPKLAREFFRGAPHFVACPVLVEEIAVHPEPSMPEKVKAPRVCAPCWEIDLKGNAIEGKAP